MEITSEVVKELNVVKKLYRDSFFRGVLNDYGQILGIITNLGFDTNSKGTIYFADIVEQSLEMLETNHSKEEVKCALENKYSSIYIECAHFLQEIKISDFCEKIEYASRNVNFNSFNLNICDEDICGINRIKTKEDIALVIAAKLYDTKERERKRIQNLTVATKLTKIIT